MASQVVQYDHIEHIVRTTAQWKEAGIANFAIPRGVLCVELLKNGTTKLKVGEGDKFYRHLPYIGGDGGDLSNYYTKEEVDRIIINLKAVTIPSTRIYPTKESLPITGNKLGEIRFVNNPGYSDPITYLWNDSKWIQLGGMFDIDLSQYVKRSEIMPRINHLEAESHTHKNKSILDQTTQPYTKEDKIKLDSLENYDDTEIKQDVEELQEKAHQHANIGILNATTANYTIEEKQKLAELENYDDFVGTDGVHPGTHGLVPAPSTSDNGKFLASDGTWKETAAELQPATTETLGGIIVGSGLDVDEHGLLSVDIPGATEYVAGDGISIDHGSSTTELASLEWEQGSINHENGTDDDTTDTSARSPFIETGLTNMINISAFDIYDVELLWELAFYDSNQTFISMTDTWQDLSGGVTVPPGAAYVRIVLQREIPTTFDSRNIATVEISYPIEIGKYVISNTGVTQIDLRDKKIVAVENGETKDVIEFGSDFDVNDGVVDLTDFHRLILNVDQ